MAWACARKGSRKLSVAAIWREIIDEEKVVGWVGCGANSRGKAACGSDPLGLCCLSHKKFQGWCVCVGV